MVDTEYHHGFAVDFISMMDFNDEKVMNRYRQPLGNLCFMLKQTMSSSTIAIWFPHCHQYHLNSILRLHRKSWNSQPSTSIFVCPDHCVHSGLEDNIGDSLVWVVKKKKILSKCSWTDQASAGPWLWSLRISQSPGEALKSCWFLSFCFSVISQL